MSEVPDARGLEVLLVEDDAGERWLLSEILRSRGHRVTACETAEAAWDAVVSSAPDLIVLDLVLPAMDGMEFCRRVRATEGGDRPVILVVTGKKEPRVLEEVLAAGADDYVAKPVDVALVNVRLAVAEREVERQRERSRVELDVRSRELETLFENLDEVFFSIDIAGGDLLQLSSGTDRVLGRPREDFARDPDLWRSLLLPPEALERLSQVGRAGADDAVTVEYQVPSGHGGPAWVEATLKAVGGESGELRRVDGVITDVTDRRRSRAAIASRNREISTLFRITELTMALGRRDEVLDDVLDEVARVTDYPIVMVERFDPVRETLRLLHARGLEVPPDGMEIPLGHTISGHAVRELRPHAETRVRRHEERLDPRLLRLGAATWLSIPMILDGAPLGALTLIHTDRVEVPRRLLRLGTSLANTLAAYLQRLEADEALRGSEARFRALAGQLQQANQELESFAYSVSHDLRAPLRTMQGFAHTLLQEHSGHLAPDARDYVRRIIASGRQAEHLIGDLLAYSRLSFEEISLERVSLDRVVRDALEQLEADLASAGAEVRVEAGLPEVRGHLTTLTRVVANLVSNAAKFVPEGRTPVIRIRGRVEEERVRVEVEDNGIGIAEEKRERIFGVFERLSSAAPSPDGTGIGLAIVRRGIERLGGEVGVDAAPDGGSVFWFELPA